MEKETAAGFFPLSGILFRYTSFCPFPPLSNFYVCPDKSRKVSKSLTLSRFYQDTFEKLIGDHYILELILDSVHIIWYSK